MELKKYGEYTDDEKRKLLFHWWRFYGRVVCSVGVINTFSAMVDEDVEEMFMIELASFVKGDKGKGLINSIREGVSDEYCQKMLNFAASREFVNELDENREAFLKMLVSSYGEKDSNIMTPEEYAEGIMNVLDREEHKLTSDRVRAIYKDCLFRSDEIVNSNIPTLPFVVGKGVNDSMVFNSERLEAHKKEIIELADELPNIESGTSFLSLCLDKNNRLWTGEYTTVDMLVQLGVAAEVFYPTLPKNLFDNDMPLVIRNRSRDDTAVKANRPGRVIKLLEKVSK